MTKKEAFIKIVRTEIFEHPDIYGENYEDIYNDAKIYFDALCEVTDKEKPKFTENGKLVLAYMKDHCEENNNLFKAKTLGESIGISSRTVSGAMRKLVADGYVEKMGADPVTYALTSLGIEASFDEE